MSESEKRGLVVVKSVMSGKILMKILGGNGAAAAETASALQAAWWLEPDEAYELALDIGLGGGQSLLVIAENKVVYKGDSVEIDQEHFCGTLQSPYYDPVTGEYGGDEVEIITVVRVKKKKEKLCYRRFFVYFVMGTTGSAVIMVLAILETFVALVGVLPGLLLNHQPRYMNWFLTRLVTRLGNKLIDYVVFEERS